MNEIFFNIFNFYIKSSKKIVISSDRHPNELNVFPVPDGDTGTNMKISITGAFEAVKSFSSNDIYDFRDYFLDNYF